MKREILCAVGGATLKTRRRLQPHMHSFEFLEFFSIINNMNTIINSAGGATLKTRRKLEEAMVLADWRVASPAAIT